MATDAAEDGDEQAVDRVRTIRDELEDEGGDEVPPSGFIGVNNGRYALDDDDDNVRAYGTYWQTVQDVADMGGGYIRMMQHCNLTWDQLRPSAFLPPPDELYAELVADDYAAFAPFTRLVVFSVVEGVRVLPTLFSFGGGAAINSPGHDDDETIHTPTSEFEPARGTTYGTLLAGKPAHQVAVIIPSVKGWAPWYWDRDRMMLDTGPFDDGDPEEEQQQYQIYALNVYNPTREGGYMCEVARRKALGLAAFGYAVGEYLATLDGTLRSLGVRLRDVVPSLECGNEFDVLWENHDGMDFATDTPSARFSASARELARFHAVLAISVRHGWSDARFGIAELASWGQVEEARFRAAWLGRALSEGLSDEAAFFDLVNEGWALYDAEDPDAGSWEEAHPRAADWMFSQFLAGIDFPPPADDPIQPADLVHSVGFHWFHWWEPDGYKNEADFVEITLTPFLELAMDAAADAGLDLSWSIGAVGFPSKSASESSAQATPGMEAAILVRFLLTALGCGAEHVLWHTHMALVEGWSIYSNMGVRHDRGDPDSYDSAADAVPKAAWFAFRRLSRLLAAARTVECVHNVAGAVLIRLTARGYGFVPPSRESERSLLAWKYAFVPWLDHTSTLESASFHLGTGEGGAFARVALVPRTGTEASGSTSRAGYAELAANPVWDEADPDDLSGFGHARQAVEVTAGGIDVTVLRTAAELDGVGANFGVVAYLTNASAWEVG